jgi:hypothetical protein
LGGLVQSQAIAAALEAGTRDVLVNIGYNAYGQATSQSAATTSGLNYVQVDLGAN